MYLGAPGPRDVKCNLLQLILGVIAHWPGLDGNDLIPRLTLFPGATFCGRWRFFSLLLPKKLLKSFEFRFFLSYTDERKKQIISKSVTVRVYVHICNGHVKERKQDFHPCISHLLLESPFTAQKYMVYQFCTPENTSYFLFI